MFNSFHFSLRYPLEPVNTVQLTGVNIALIGLYLEPIGAKVALIGSKPALMSAHTTLIGSSIALMGAAFALISSYIALIGASNGGKTCGIRVKLSEIWVFYGSTVVRG
jgi:hypothetical protein